MPCLNNKVLKNNNSISNDISNGNLNNNNNIDPNIHNGMMTKVWGPAGWLFLHCITFGYPYELDMNKKEDLDKAIKYKNFFKLIGEVLPCRYCRESYLDFINEHPIDPNLVSREKLTKWFYDIHNKVNHKLGVPNCEIPSFQEVKDQYEQYRAKCKKTTENERLKNAAKGCVRPADGTPKRCIVKVVSCKKGDITRREDSDDVKLHTVPSQNEYYLLHRDNVIILIVIGALLFVLLIIMSIIIFKNKQKLKLKLF
jgi:hypothetical protein